MIRYSLICDLTHEFEGWFRNSEDFDAQREARHVQCPICGSQAVHKSLMAPAVSTARKKTARPGDASEGQSGSSSTAGDLPAAGVNADEKSPGSDQLALLPPDIRRQEIAAGLRALRNRIVENSEHVGDRFAEEARKMHYGETEERRIYGEATRDDAEALIEEGIAVLPVPLVPDDKN